MKQGLPGDVKPLFPHTIVMSLQNLIAYQPAPAGLKFVNTFAPKAQPIANMPKLLSLAILPIPRGAKQMLADNMHF